MYRVRLVAAAAAALGTALSGCSGSSVSMPDWLTIKPPPPATQALQFESQPPGADVRTAQGQTCKTPCSLALPLTSQSVTFAMKGYEPQTVPIEVHQPEHVAFETSTPPADFSPNPVEVSLLAARKKSPGRAKPKPGKTAGRTRTAAKTATPAANSFPAPTQSAAFSQFPMTPAPQTR